MKISGVCLIIILSAAGLSPVSTVAAGFTEKDRALLIRLDERLNQVDKRFEQADKRLNDLRSDMNKRFEQMGQRIDELRFDMNKRFELVDKRFEDMDKRFGDMNKRFEDINKRFEDINKRFDSMLKIMLGIVAAFASIVAVAIGFAIWDRRTMIRPFENRTREIEEKILIDHKKLHDLIEILKKYARQDKKLAELLRSLSLL